MVNTNLGRQERQRKRGKDNERERGGKGKHVKALQTDKQNGNSYNLPLALSVEAEAWACPQRVVGVVVGTVVAIAGAAATGNPQRKSCSGCAFNYWNNPPVRPSWGGSHFFSAFLSISLSYIFTFTFTLFFFLFNCVFLSFFLFFVCDNLELYLLLCAWRQFYLFYVNNAGSNGNADKAPQVAELGKWLATFWGYLREPFGSWAQQVRGGAGQASAQGQQPQLMSRSLLNALISWGSSFDDNSPDLNDSEELFPLRTESRVLPPPACAVPQLAQRERQHYFQRGAALFPPLLFICTYSPHVLCLVFVFVFILLCSYSHSYSASYWFLGNVC